MASSDAKPPQEGAEENDCCSKNERSWEGDHEQYDTESHDSGGGSHCDWFGCEPFVSGAPSGPTLLCESILIDPN